MDFASSAGLWTGEMLHWTVRRLTKSILQVLHKWGFLQTVLSLHVIRGDVAGAVGCVADSPPGLGIIEQPQALVLPDVQFLVLLSRVVPLGYNNHLLCHLSSSPTTKREKEKEINYGRRANSITWPTITIIKCQGKCTDKIENPYKYLYNIFAVRQWVKPSMTNAWLRQETDMITYALFNTS